ncbi:MAG: hypothetical protein LWX07_12360 [Bacteroidetes bacterium]|nr:hypothetical protein [Bacteroidota bacterium]
MKNITILLIAILMSAAIMSCGKKETADKTTGKDGDKKEQTGDTKSNPEIGENSSLHVVYEMNSGNKMTLELYTKGPKARSEAENEAAGMKIKSTAYFPGDGYIYSVSDIGREKMGMKMKVTEGDENDMSSRMFDAKEHLKDFEKEGTGDVIGYTCNIYKDKDGNKYYFYKDYVMLKFEGKGSGMTATKLELNAKTDDSMFEVPKDISFKEMDMSKFKKK